MSTTPIPAHLRRMVIERDGINCLRCGVQCTPDWWTPTALHIDHIVPEAHGGPTVLDNLQVLCAGCNLAKGASHRDYRGGTVADKIAADDAEELKRQRREARAARKVKDKRRERRKELLLQAGLTEADLPRGAQLAEVEAICARRKRVA